MTEDAPPKRPDTLAMLDLAQTAAAYVVARVDRTQWDLPTPCTEWSVIDIINKLTASTTMFTSFGLREQPDPGLDLINPNHVVGEDPLGAYEREAAACRAAWRQPAALEGMATSTIGEAKARAVLNARIFDTTILTTDIAAACGLAHGIDDELAAYVLRIAKALVPAVRSASPERYQDPVELGSETPVVDQMIAATGRDPHWQPRVVSGGFGN